MAVPPDLTAYESFLAEGDIGYDAPPGQLGLVDPGAGLKYDPRHHGWGSDVYAWHLGGGQGMPPSGIMTQVPGTTVQGTGGGGGGNDCDQRAIPEHSQCSECRTQKVN